MSETRDPRLVEWLRLHAYLDELDERLRIYKANHKAEILATKDKIKILRDELRGIRGGPAQLSIISDTIRSKAK